MHDIDDILADLDAGISRASARKPSERHPNNNSDLDSFMDDLLNDKPARTTTNMSAPAKPAAVPIKQAASPVTPAPKQQQSRPVTTSGLSIDDLLADLNEPNKSEDFDPDQFLNDLNTPAQKTPVKSSAQTPYKQPIVQAAKQPTYQPQAATIKRKDDFDSLLNDLDNPMAADLGNLDDLLGITAPKPNFSKPTPNNAPTQNKQNYYNAPVNRNPSGTNTGGNLSSLLASLPPTNDSGNQKLLGHAGDSKEVEDLISNLSNQLGNVNIANKGICASCNKAIVGDAMNALGKKWHVDHWVCASCQVPLGANQYYETNGMPNCVKCHTAMFAPRCGSCGEPIFGKCVTALGKKMACRTFCMPNLS